MNKEELRARELVGVCVKAMKHNNIPINLNSLLFGITHNGDLEWTYFDILAHEIANKLQGVELTDDEVMLTDDEIMMTIKLFIEYVKENNIK